MITTMLTGKAGVGKDTYAEEHYPDCKKYAFADYLKVIARLLGWDGIKDEKGRKFLQELGDVVNRYNDRFWTGKVIEAIKQDFPRNDYHMMACPPHVVITDLRYDHEVEYMREAFPNAIIEVIELVREFDSKLSQEAQQHPSEQGIKPEYTTKVVRI